MTTKRSNHKAKIAMKRAWELARKGRSIFGGSVRQYLAEALREAWAALKADPVVREAEKIIAGIRAAKASGSWQPCYMGRNSYRAAYYAASW